MNQSMCSYNYVIEIASVEEEKSFFSHTASSTQYECNLERELFSNRN